MPGKNKIDKVKKPIIYDKLPLCFNLTFQFLSKKAKTKIKFRMGA